MKIPDVDFELSNTGSWYFHNTIHIGLPNNHKLTDDEVTEFITDSITHEYIHHILTNLFSETLSCLFDALGDRLRRIELTRKVFNYFNGEIELWSDGIARDGINVLVDTYCLDRSDVNKILREGC